MIAKTSLGTVLAGLMTCVSVMAAPPKLPNPDFTNGEKIPVGAVNDWNLGATGLRGWMHSHQQKTVEARQVAITKVAEGSPGSELFEVGDVLLGIAGEPFSYDPRTEIGKALTEAEAKDGKLMLTRWRDGNTDEVSVQLPVLGSYGPTAPYDCEKSKMILDNGCEALAEKMASPDYKENAISRSLNALGLLASGDEKYYPILKKEAEWAANYSVEGFAVWWYGYVTVFLSEYIMATGDKSVLPGLRRIAMEAAKGQSVVGSWGHRFAGEDGRLFGYGMMNSPGAVLTIGMVLAREAGVDDPEVATAIEKSVRLLRFYIGKGSVPYGDHAPYMAGHEDNGKCGMAAVLFDQLGDEKGTKFFSKMSTAAHGNERDKGHTGNYFNMIWAMPGVSRGGPEATGAWMKEFGSWYFDLAREWDWSFPHQGPPQSRNDSYANWDATGVYLIVYAMPRKAIRLTGSKPSSTAPFSKDEAKNIILDGRGLLAPDLFGISDKYMTDMLVSQLSNWSPIVRQRASEALAKRKDVPVDTLISLLDNSSLEARLGACTALGMLGGRAEPAVPKLIETLEADDLWLRVQAAKALSSLGDTAKKAVPDILKILAKGPTDEDPRGMEQRFIAQSLFGARNGMLGRSLDGVDRAQLLAAVRATLVNEDGRTRGSLATVYKNLTFEELKPILPAIHQAIIEKSPSGIMFDGQIQSAGLDLYSRNHISEGIELLAAYTFHQKKHGSQKRIESILEMLKRYGAHAQRGIPLLEKAIYYFENEEKDFPKAMSLEKAESCRKAIKEIKAMTDKPELRKLNL